ncbi:MAG: hypothetical protein RR904_06950 [Bacilli bacterium]
MHFKSKNNLDKINFIRKMETPNEIGDDFLDIRSFLLNKLSPLEFIANDTTELWKIIQHLQEKHADFLKDDYFKSMGARSRFIVKHGDPSQRSTLLTIKGNSRQRKKNWKKLTQAVGTNDSEAFREVKRLEKIDNTVFED